MKDAQGGVVGINGLSMSDAKLVLRRAAELSPEADLSDETLTSSRCLAAWR